MQQQQRQSNNPVYGMSKYRLQQELLLSQKRVNSPKADLVELGEHYIVRVEFPGVEQSNISFELKDDQIALFSVEKPLLEDPNEKVVYRECRYGKIMRKVKLPGKVHQTEVSKSFENGVLTVVFQKSE